MVSSQKHDGWPSKKLNTLKTKAFWVFEFRWVFGPLQNEQNCFTILFATKTVWQADWEGRKKTRCLPHRPERMLLPFLLLNKLYSLSKFTETSTSTAGIHKKIFRLLKGLGLSTWCVIWNKNGEVYK
jgi:hypothetical protein